METARSKREKEKREEARVEEGWGCAGVSPSLSFLHSPSSEKTVSDLGYASSLTSAMRAMALAAMATRLAPSRACMRRKSEVEVRKKSARRARGCPFRFGGEERGPLSSLLSHSLTLRAVAMSAAALGLSAGGSGVGGA